MQSALPLLLTLAVLPLACGKPKDAAPPAATNAAAAGHPLTAPLDYVGAVGQAGRGAAQTTDLLTLQQAIRAFEAGEGRAPSSLNELVSEGYLPRLPAPPRGMAWSYDPAGRRVTVAPAR